MAAERVQLAGRIITPGRPCSRAQYLEMRVSAAVADSGRDGSQPGQPDRCVDQSAYGMKTDESSLDGLLAAAEAGSAAQDWLSGPGVAGRCPGQSDRQHGRAPGTVFLSNRSNWNGFAAGRPLDFRFRGNVGDPELFDWLEVDGLLVPLSNGNFRLSNMRMLGELEQGHFELEMLGNLSFTPGPPLAVALDEGRLRINQHQFQAARGLYRFRPALRQCPIVR